MNCCLDFKKETLPLSLSLYFSLSLSHLFSLCVTVFENCVKYQSRFASHVKLMKLQRDLRHGTTESQSAKRAGVWWVGEA